MNIHIPELSQNTDDGKNDIAKKKILALLFNYNLCFLNRFSFFRLFDGKYYSHLLHLRKPDPAVYTHVIDDLGLDPGDAVFLVTARGKVRYIAFVSEDIVLGVIEANAGGGSPIASQPWRECNVNELTDFDNRDPISGFPVYKALLCDVIPAVGRDGSEPPHAGQSSEGGDRGER